MLQKGPALMLLSGGDAGPKAAQPVSDNARNNGNADAHNDLRIHLEAACMSRLSSVTDKTDDVIGDCGDR